MIVLAPRILAPAIYLDIHSHALRHHLMACVHIHYHTSMRTDDGHGWTGLPWHHSCRCLLEKLSGEQSAIAIVSDSAAYCPIR